MGIIRVIRIVFDTQLLFSSNLHGRFSGYLSFTGVPTLESIHSGKANADVALLAISGLPQSNLESKICFHSGNLCEEVNHRCSLYI